MEVDGVRCHVGEKPPKTIFSSYLGKLVLTEHELLFYSTGKSGWKQALLGALTRPRYTYSPLQLRLEEEATRNLDSTALSNRGSMRVRFGEIVEAKIVEKLGTKYLFVRLRDGKSVWFWKYFNVNFPAEKLLEQILSRASQV